MNMQFVCSQSLLVKISPAHAQSLACGILMSVCYTPHPSCLYGIVPHSCCSSSHLLKKHQLSCNDPKSVDQLLLYPMLDSYTVQLGDLNPKKIAQLGQIPISEGFF